MARTDRGRPELVKDMRLRTLDTNIVSRYRHGVPHIVERFKTMPRSQRTVAIITAEEQLSGWYNSLRQAKSDERVIKSYVELGETIEFYALIRILPYNAEALAHYRRFLALNLNVAKADLRIAAIAIAHDAVVVTQNARDFARIPGLIVESWDDPIK